MPGSPSSTWRNGVIIFGYFSAAPNNHLLNHILLAAHKASQASNPVWAAQAGCIQP
jgi:hypothetical protein